MCVDGIFQLLFTCANAVPFFAHKNLWSVPMVTDLLKLKAYRRDKSVDAGGGSVALKDLLSLPRSLFISSAHSIIISHKVKIWKEYFIPFGKMYWIDFEEERSGSWTTLCAVWEHESHYNFFTSFQERVKPKRDITFTEQYHNGDVYLLTCCCIFVSLSFLSTMPWTKLTVRA